VRGGEGVEQEQGAKATGSERSWRAQLGEWLEAVAGSAVQVQVYRWARGLVGGEKALG
jgi:hypothetical protein